MATCNRTYPSAPTRAALTHKTLVSHAPAHTSNTRQTGRQARRWGKETARIREYGNMGKFNEVCTEIDQTCQTSSPRRQNITRHAHTRISHRAAGPRQQPGPRLRPTNVTHTRVSPHITTQQLTLKDCSARGQCLQRCVPYIDADDSKISHQTRNKQRSCKHT